jgi:membrane protein DedA with SNARE-associated domain
MKEAALHLVIHYGYLGLFCSMALGIIGLPIPDETILTFAGYLVSKKDLQLIPTIISSFLGSISGISISFLLGHTLGTKALNKLGRIFHFTDKNLDKTKKWFESYGSWFFLFGYFIPGIRHLTALTAGSTRINYYKFAVFAYAGGFLWSLSFILIGYFVGKKWMVYIEKIHNHFIILIAITIFIILIYFLVRNKLVKTKNF